MTAMKKLARAGTMIAFAPLMWLPLWIANAQSVPQTVSAEAKRSTQEQTLGNQDLIQPKELAAILQTAKEKPLVFQVGFHVLYQQAHIPGSEYVNPASSVRGLQELRNRVQAIPRDKAIVLYCGCCPWSRCPNVKPAFAALRSMGFKQVKVLYIADNFGVDWVDKGYPVTKGE